VWFRRARLAMSAPVRSASYAALRQKIHLSQTFRFTEPPLSARLTLRKSQANNLRGLMQQSRE
jgi:hypothetical protein